MSDGVKMILVALGAGLGTYIGIVLAGTLCIDAVTSTWNPLVTFLFCTMFPVALAVAGVVLVLKLVQNA